MYARYAAFGRVAKGLPGELLRDPASARLNTEEAPTQRLVKQDRAPS